MSHSTDRLTDDSITRPAYEIRPSIGSMRVGSYTWEPVSQETKVSSLPSQLAGLTDPASVPRMIDEIALDDLTTSEAYVVSLMTFELTLGTIVDSSPLDSDETLDFLARLIGEGYVTLESGA
jgi:hypothetical protein